MKGKGLIDIQKTWREILGNKRFEMPSDLCYHHNCSFWRSGISCLRSLDGFYSSVITPKVCKPISLNISCKFLPSIRRIDFPKVLWHHDVWGNSLGVRTYNSSTCEHYFHNKKSVTENCWIFWNREESWFAKRMQISRRSCVSDLKKMTFWMNFKEV